MGVLSKYGLFEVDSVSAVFVIALSVATNAGESGGVEMPVSTVGETGGGKGLGEQALKLIAIMDKIINDDFIVSLPLNLKGTPNYVLTSRYAV